MLKEKLIAVKGNTYLVVKHSYPKHKPYSVHHIYNDNFTYQVLSFGKKDKQRINFNKYKHIDDPKYIGFWVYNYLDQFILNDF